MLLRSSSTPVLGSLISTIAESPNNSHHQSELHGTGSKHIPSPNCSKLSCSNGGGLSKSLMTSPSGQGRTTSSNEFRRVQSDGNLEQLAIDSYIVEDFGFSNQYYKKFARKPNLCSLEPIPSFSQKNSGTSFEDYTDSEDEEYETEEDEEMDVEGNGRTFRAENLAVDEAIKNLNSYGNFGFQSEGKLYLAAGLGVSDFCNFDNGGDGSGHGGGNFRPVDFDRHSSGGGDHGLSVEEHYKKMLEGNPGNPLFLRNYAQYLYQTKGDLIGAEEYYSRAILADQEDGEILAQYAKLIWELHHDKERATNYFERAVQASFEDSHIQAAYASFLWDIEDDDEEENTADNSQLGLHLFHNNIMASATA